MAPSYRADHVGSLLRPAFSWRRVGMTARIPRKWLSAVIRPGISPHPEVRSGRRGGTSRAARAVSGLPTGGSGAAPPTSPCANRALQSQRRARSHDGPRIGRRTRLLETSTIQAVSRPCSSNRTCGFPASGSRTGLTPRHAQAAHCEDAAAGTRPAPRRCALRGSASSLATRLCGAAAETAAHAP